MVWDGHEDDLRFIAALAHLDSLQPARIPQGSRSIEQGGDFPGRAVEADSSWEEDKPIESGESDDEEVGKHEWPKSVWASMNHRQRRNWNRRKKRQIAKDRT